MDTLECIKTRASIRKYQDRPLVWDDVVKILDAGRLAPSSGNLQAWKFIVVLDKAKREQIADACLQQYWMATAPVHIVICSEPEKVERYYGVRGERLYSVQNCSAAAENMLLAAHSLGLGGCWIGAFDEDMVKNILGIPKEARPQIILTIGYPDEKPPKQIKHPLTTIIYQNKWRGFYTEADLIFSRYGEHVMKKAKETGEDVKRTGKHLMQKIKEKFGKKE